MAAAAIKQSLNMALQMEHRKMEILLFELGVDEFVFEESLV